jgi:hypothetical protein
VYLFVVLTIAYGVGVYYINEVKAKKLLAEKMDVLIKKAASI